MRVMKSSFSIAHDLLQTHCCIVRYCKALLLAASRWFIPHVTCVDWFCACYWWCALPRPYSVHLARSYLWRWRL